MSEIKIGDNVKIIFKDKKRRDKVYYGIVLNFVLNDYFIDCEGYVGLYSRKSRHYKVERNEYNG